MSKNYYHNLYKDKTKAELIDELIHFKQQYFLENMFEEDFASLFTYSPIITFIVSNSTLDIVAANDMFLKTLKLSYSEVIGSKLHCLPIWPGHFDIRNFLQHIAEPTSSNEEYTLLTSDHETLKFQISSMHYHKNKDTYIIIWANDITRLAKSRKDLAEINKQLSTILDNSPTIVTRYDRKLNCIYVNQAIEKLVGLPPSAIVGKNLRNYNAPKTFKALWTNQLTTVFQTKKPLVFSSKYKSPLGREIFYQTRLIPELDDSGEISCVLSTSYDITALKNAEYKLLQFQARSTWFLNTIPDIMFKHDIEGNYLDYNGSRRELMEHPGGTIIGKNVKDVLPLEIAQKVIDTIQLVHTTQTTQLFYYSLDINDKMYHFEGRITTIPKSKEFLLIIRDVTELKELRDKVDRLNRLQLVSEIASTIGHEIRNPITTVKGFLQLMRRKNEYQNWNEQFNLMISELDHSNEIITKFLALTHDKTPLAERQGLDELIAQLNT